MEADIYGKRLCLDPWGEMGAVSRVVYHSALNQTFRITLPAVLRCALPRERRLAQTQVTAHPLTPSSHYLSHRHRLRTKMIPFSVKKASDRFKDFSAPVRSQDLASLQWEKMQTGEKNTITPKPQGNVLKISILILLGGKTSLQIINKLLSALTTQAVARNKPSKSSLTF